MSKKPVKYLQPGEKTELGAYYYIRNVKVIDTVGNGGWHATRRNGEPYYKLWMPGSNEYEGGADLDAWLAGKGDLRLVKVKD